MDASYTSLASELLGGRTIIGVMRWFHKTYPSYNLQPLLLKRYQELDETRAFNNWPGERRGAAAPGRREPADGGRAPPGTPAALRAGQAPGVERAAGEVAQQ